MIPRFTRKILWFTLLLTAWTLGSPGSSAFAQDKPVEIIVGTTAGGILDRTARLIAHILQSQRLTRSPVTVVNKPGGGQTVAMTYLSQRPADENSLFVASLPIVTGQIVGRTALKYDHFTPIYHLFDEFIVLAVKEDSPLRNGRDFIEQLRKDPRALSISLGTGLGNAPHVAVSVILDGVKVDIRQLRVVTHRGGGEAITNVLGGHVDVLATSVTNVLELVKTGRLRLLAVTSPQRLGDALADVPTWRELGVDAVSSSFRCAFAPPGLTRAHVEHWEKLLHNVTERPEWKQEITKNYWRAVNGGSAETAQFLKEEYTRDRYILEKLGLAK